MAKIGLAAELAKQAAQAAREEVAAAEGRSAEKVASKGWTVPQLASDFMLDSAVNLATRQVAGHYRQVLAPQGLEVHLDAAAGDFVAEERQEVPSMQAELREQVSGRLVKAYTVPALLTLFATQQQATGVVVDGQV